MAFYVIEYRYNPELQNLVSDVRPAHRTYLRKLEAEQKLVSSGFFKDAAYNGGMMILRAESAAEALELLDADPFSLNGLLIDVRVRQWIPTIGQHAEEFDTEFPVS